MNADEKRERPVEQEAVNTTIVGGRPPGSGRGIGNIPRGIEVLVKKAAVDAAFRAALVETRSKAAGLIGLPLTSAEAAMLDIVPRAQLEAVIARTTVHPNQLPAFLGCAAAVMLVALGATGCDTNRMPVTKGISPDVPPDRQEKPAVPDNQTVPRAKTAAVETLTYEDTSGFVTFSPGGNMADRPKPKAAGERESIKPNAMAGSGGMRADAPRRKAPVVTPPAPSDAGVSADAAKAARAVDAALRVKEAQDALERFQVNHVRVAKHIEVENRVRLYRDNPAAPGAAARLEAEEANLKALGDVPADALAAYKAQLAQLLAGLRKAKAEVPR